MYKLLPTSPTGAEAQCIKRLADNAFIPFDEQNSDFAEYQRWLAEGHEPLPADTPGDVETDSV
jgi:hypothetical protein